MALPESARPKASEHKVDLSARDCNRGDPHKHQNTQIHVFLVNTWCFKAAKTLTFLFSATLFSSVNHNHTTIEDSEDIDSHGHAVNVC